MKQLVTWFVSVIAAATLACCVGCGAGFKNSDLTFAESLQYESVALVRERDHEMHAYCSGVWIGKEMILTAAHCVTENDDKPEISPVGNSVNYFVPDDISGKLDVSSLFSKSRLGVIVAYDENIDLALISTPKAPEHDFVRLTSDDIKAGDEVHIVGHPAGLWWTYSRGVVSATRVMDGPLPIKQLTLQISAPVWFGNSGGGAFNERGELIGISSYIYPKGPSLSFFVHRDTIYNFLRTNHVISK